MSFLHEILKAAAKKPRIDDEPLGEDVKPYDPNESQNQKNQKISEVNDKKSEEYKNRRLLEDEARGTHGTANNKTKFNKGKELDLDAIEEELDEIEAKHSDKHDSTDAETPNEKQYSPDDSAPGRKGEKVPIDEEDQDKLEKARKKKKHTSEANYDPEATVEKGDYEPSKSKKDDEEEPEKDEDPELAPEDWEGRAKKVAERANKKYWDERQLQKASEIDYNPNETATDKPVIERGKGYDEKAMFSTEPEGSIEMADPSGITAEKTELSQSEELPECLRHMKKLVQW